MMSRLSLLPLVAAAACLGRGTLQRETCAATPEALFAERCLPCHSSALTGEARGGATYGVDFDTEGEIQRHAAIIRDEALLDKTMPLDRPLSACDQRLLDVYLTDLAAGPCIVSCSGRVCGDDNCEGRCGECEASLVCDPAGQCAAGRCEAQCVGAACGDDACGGVCGACDASLVCSAAGTCVCQANCVGRACGDDGCGGSCGSCPAGDTCNHEGGCVCIPSCAGRACGDDGCGGQCGDCGSLTCVGDACVCVSICSGPPARECGPDGCGGTCAPNSCGGPTPICDTDRGTCVANCDGSCTGRECGDDGCGTPCGPLAGACPSGEVCIDNQCACARDCQGKQCGDDGCGGSCGQCAAGLACVLGQCGCTGSCDGRECGGDGCGGTCGSACPAGESCSQDGRCVCAPSCSGKSCGPDGCGRECGTCGGGAACQDGACVWPETSFATQVYPVFQAVGCGSSSQGGQTCHGGVRPAEKLDLSTVSRAYAELVNVPSEKCNAILVVPNDPELSYLLVKLAGGEMCFGTIMPKADQPLSPAQIDTVRAWIGSGAAP